MARRSDSTKEPGKRDLWDIPVEPLPEPLPHQFRYSDAEQRCEADFQAMTLSVVRFGDLIMSEEPLLYDCGHVPIRSCRRAPYVEQRQQDDPSFSSQMRQRSVGENTALVVRVDLHI
jgi:hypothetical protein